MIILNAEVKKETEKAIFVSMFVGVEISFWLPKSQVQEINAKTKRITAAEWLKKNIVEAYLRVEFDAPYILAAANVNKCIID